MEAEPQTESMGALRAQEKPTVDVALATEAAEDAAEDSAAVQAAGTVAAGAPNTGDESHGR